MGVIIFLIFQIKLEKDKDRNMVGCTLNSDLKECVIERCQSSDTPPKDNRRVFKTCLRESVFHCKE